jgi:4-amino-4-deoxy-L-arabinose transferase-like glycosyltransferase
MQRRWVLVAILVLAAGVRLAWVALVDNAQYSDSVWYDAAAANLAANGIYGPDQPSAWFPPGYPFFLAAIYKFVGHNQEVGKLANVVVGVALTATTYLLGRVAFGETVGLVSALLVAVWPNLVFHTGILSSDLLAALGFVAVMWLGMRRTGRHQTVLAVGIVLGVLIGWMALVRPVSLILLPGIGLWWWISSGSYKQALLRLAPVVLVMSVIIGAWTARNYAQFGQVITIATNGGYNFWQTNQPYADGNDTFWPFVPMDDPEYQTMSSADEFTKNREGYRYAFAFLREHPLHIVTMLPTKLFWLYHTDTSGLYEGVLDAPMLEPSPLQAWMQDHQRLVETLTFRYYEALMALGVIGIASVLILTRSKYIWPLISLPLLLTFFHVFFHAKDRFHMPIDGIVAIVAAVALVEIARIIGSNLSSVLPPRGTRSVD